MEEVEGMIGVEEGRVSFVTTSGESGPTLVNSPFLSISTISRILSSSADSSLPLPTNCPFSSLPIWIARLIAEDCDEGRMEPPNECDARVVSGSAPSPVASREALNFEMSGLGGLDARVASRGTS